MTSLTKATQQTTSNCDFIGQPCCNSIHQMLAGGLNECSLGSSSQTLPTKDINMLLSPKQNTFFDHKGNIINLITLTAQENCNGLIRGKVESIPESMFRFWDARI